MDEVTGEHNTGSGTWVSTGKGGRSYQAWREAVVRPFCQELGPRPLRGPVGSGHPAGREPIQGLTPWPPIPSLPVSCPFSAEWKPEGMEPILAGRVASLPGACVVERWRVSGLDQEGQM